MQWCQKNIIQINTLRQMMSVYLCLYLWFKLKYNTVKILCLHGLFEDDSWQLKFLGLEIKKGLKNYF